MQSKFDPCKDKRNTFIVLSILFSAIMMLLFVHWANPKINAKFYSTKKPCSTSYMNGIAFFVINIIVMLPIFWECKFAPFAGAVTSTMIFYILTNTEAIDLYSSLGKSDVCTSFGVWFSSGTNFTFGVASILLTLSYVFLRYMMFKDHIPVTSRY